MLAFEYLWSPTHGAHRLALFVTRLRPIDVQLADTVQYQEHFIRQRSGYAPLRGADGNPAAHRWRMSRLKFLGYDDDARTKIAIINIGAYHSRQFLDHHVLAALPSSRVMLDWAQSFLFFQAERGERMIVCMRAANCWGLEPKYGEALYAAVTTRSGHMQRDAFRAEIEQAARRFLNR